MNVAEQLIDELLGEKVPDLAKLKKLAKDNNAATVGSKKVRFMNAGQAKAFLKAAGVKISADTKKMLIAGSPVSWDELL